MICRVCLENNDDQRCGSIPIYEESCPAQEWSIAHVIQQHFWFKPLPDDDISKTICIDCWTRLSDFHQFYLTIVEAHRVLRDGRGVVEAATQPAEDVYDDDNTKIETVATSAEQIIYEIDIKEELVEPHQNVNLLSDSGKTEEVLVVESAENPLFQAEDITDPTAQSPSSSSSPSILKVQRKRGRNTQTPEEDAADSTLSSVSPKRRQKLLTYSTHDDEIIKKHISMGCELCTFVGENFAQISKHFRVVHNNDKPYVICCDLKLNKRTKVLQHALRHEDPEFFKCVDCLKVFANNYVLRSHRLANHAPEEELKYACDQCPRKFSRRQFLAQHRPSHIPVNERQFVCEKCPLSKPFASDHLLKIHVSMRHTKAVNVCHVCAKEIRDNQAFEKHVRLHFEDSGPRVKCLYPECDSWLKDEDNLKQHMRRHKDDGQIFTCDECGKVCKNRRSLSSHLHYAHSKEVFTCEECNKTFKKAITLKEHMAQHTGETLYKCPFCERTFNSNANMHSHKKKMHPVEWDNWRKTKRGSSQQLLSGKAMS